MDIVCTRINALYLSPWILLLKNILSRELLVATAWVINSLAFIHHYILVVLYLSNLLIFQISCTLQLIV